MVKILTKNHKIRPRLAAVLCGGGSGSRTAHVPRWEAPSSPGWKRIWSWADLSHHHDILIVFFVCFISHHLPQYFAPQRGQTCFFSAVRLNVHSMELPDSAPVVSGIHSVLRLLDEHSLRAVKNLVREGAMKDSKFCEQAGLRLGKMEAWRLGKNSYMDGIW